jgi:hypothetical protein
MDAVEGVAQVVGQWVGGSDGVGTGRNFDGAGAAVVRVNFLTGQPVLSSIQRLTARAANTMVRWASIELRWWW